MVGKGRTQKTAIVVLSHNSADVLRVCLPTLKAQSKGGSLFLVDNASQDNSIAVGSAYVETLHIIALKKNGGYAGGYNEGLQAVDTMCSPTYYVLINPDVLVTTGWLSPLVTWMDERPQVAACQPTLRNYYRREHFDFSGAAGGFIDSLGYPFCRGRVFSSVERDKGQYKACKIFWASGACLVLRRNAFWAVGGFDPKFFMYMEEIDLCWRLQQTGYDIHHCPSSVVYHMGTSPLNKKQQALYHDFRNSLFMLYKNTMPRWALLYKLPLRMCLDYLSIILWVSRGKVGSVYSVLRAHWDFMRGLTWGELLKEKKTPMGVARLPYSGSIAINYFLFGRKKCPRQLRNSLA